jgi:menaquinone-dependent protoporphyrinogen oxidase
MKVLILFATEEGHTGRIARFIEDAAKDLGCDVELVDADEPAELGLDGIDSVVLAAPVHQRRHPRNFEALVSAYSERLNELKTLLISVSLSAAFPEGLEEAGEYVVEMKMRTALQPDTELLVAGAIRTSHYDYFAMQVVRHVVLRNRDIDLKLDEHVFTDWSALSAAVSKFLTEKN